MANRVLPLFTARGKAKSLDAEITATTRRAIDVWLRKVGEGSSRVDRVRANEIRLALLSRVSVPSDDAIAWLRRRARAGWRECGWLARAALEEMGR